MHWRFWGVEMPKDYVYETCIVIDHETGEVRADTTREGMASKLTRQGFIEVTKPNSKPYRRFLGIEKQVSLRKAASTSSKRSSILAQESMKKVRLGRKK